MLTLTAHDHADLDLQPCRPTLRALVQLAGPAGMLLLTFRAHQDLLTLSDGDSPRRGALNGVGLGLVASIARHHRIMTEQRSRWGSGD